MEKNKFLRIGTVYYKVVELPLPSGDTKTERKVWTYETIRQDYGKDYIAQFFKQSPARNEPFGMLFNL